MSDNARLQSQIEFIVEIDRLKQVLRRTLINDKSRQENSAEHSWHIALMAIILSEYAEKMLVRASMSVSFRRLSVYSICSPWIRHSSSSRSGRSLKRVKP
jgi:hypothetical protein